MITSSVWPLQQGAIELLGPVILAGGEKDRGTVGGHVPEQRGPKAQEPVGSEAGMVRRAVVVTGARVLAAGSTVIQIVPLTRTLRGYASEVTVSADATNGLMEDSAAQCQHVRAVASARIRETLGNVGPVSMAQIRDVLAVLLDL
jgi:mRNA interferase MazF